MDMKLFFGSVGAGLAIMLLIAYFRGGTAGDYIIALIAVAVVAGFGLLANLWESRWVKKVGRTAKELNSKEERAKAQTYAVTHGFSKLHGKTMKSDLLYRTQGGVWQIFLGIFLVAVGLAVAEGAAWVRIVTALVGLALFVYGIYRLTGQPVRKFLKKTEQEGKNLDEISADYINGRILAEKKTGLCIGDKYTVCWNPSANIFVFRHIDIAFAGIRMKTVRSYYNGIFSGGKIEYQLVFLLKEPQLVSKDIFTHEITAVIGKYQIEMAYSEYKRLGIELKSDFPAGSEQTGF